MFQTFDRLARPLGDAVTLRSSARISVDGGVVYGPRIAAIAAGFAIVWNEAEQVLVATVGTDGRLLQGPAQMDGDELDGDVYVSVAAAGNRVLVGWSGRPPLSGPAVPPPTITATRAFSDRLIALGTALNLDDTSISGGMHQVLAAGSGFLALWARDTAVGTQVSVAQLDSAGVPTRAAATLAPPVGGSYRYLAPAAWNRDHLVVLWDRSATNQNGLTLTRFALHGAAQGPSIELPTMSPATGLYLAARDGQDRIVGFIWTETLGPAYEVYFRQARALPLVSRISE